MSTLAQNWEQLWKTLKSLLKNGTFSLDFSPNFKCIKKHASLLKRTGSNKKRGAFRFGDFELDEWLTLYFSMPVTKHSKVAFLPTSTVKFLSGVIKSGWPSFMDRTENIEANRWGIYFLPKQIKTCNNRCCSLYGKKMGFLLTCILGWVKSLNFFSNFVCKKSFLRRS